MKIGILFPKLDVESRALTDALIKRGIDVEGIQTDNVNLSLEPKPSPDSNDVDKKETLDDKLLRQGTALIIVREPNYFSAYPTVTILESYGIPCVNGSSVIYACSNKVDMVTRLLKARVPTLPARFASSPNEALEIVEGLGYPCVIKPLFSSGKLLSLVRDRNAAETVLEHKNLLGKIDGVGNTHHSVYFIQKYFPNANNRDIKAFLVGDEVICAVYRTSKHWIRRTSTGGEVENCPLDEYILDVAKAAAKAVGGGLLSVTLTENGREHLVIDINPVPRFRHSKEVTNVDIAGIMIDYAIQVAKQTQPQNYLR